MRCAAVVLRTTTENVIEDSVGYYVINVMCHTIGGG